MKRLDSSESVEQAFPFSFDIHEYIEVLYSLGHPEIDWMGHWGSQL